VIYHGHKIELESGFPAVLIWLVSTAVAIGGLVFAVWQLKVEQSATPGYVPLIFGGGVSFVSWRMMKRGPDHIRIHVPTGVVDHVTNGQTITMPLPRLSEMTITTYRRARGPNHPDWHKLEVPGNPRHVLFEDINRPRVERLRTTLHEAVVQDAVRRLLAGEPLDASAAADPLAYVRRLVPEPIPRDAALAALEKDPDAQIAAKAAELRRNVVVGLSSSRSLGTLSQS